MRRLLAFTLVLITSLRALHGADTAFAPANPQWNRPIEPFTIVGNVHYVGASDVSAFLITTPEGHMLVDGGFRETVPLIEASISRLGFRIEDVRVLLVSHAHCDHAGCMADLKARTGARVHVGASDVALMQRGGAGDPAFGDDFRFPAVAPDVAVHDGDRVTLGGTTVTAHATPGHTRGSTTWSLPVKDGDLTRQVVIACSLSAPGYRLVGEPVYPEIVADFESTFATLRALPCDVLLSSHSWDFQLHEKRAALAEPGAANPFIDAAALKAYVATMEERLRQQIREQTAGPAGAVR